MSPYLFTDLSADILRFFIGIHKLAEMDLFSFFILCPKSLALSAYVVLDHLVGGIQDILGRTVILLQLDHQGLGKDLLISQDIADIGSPEFINRLVVISYYAKIFILVCQKTDKLKLSRIGILILIYHNVFKPFLIIIQNIWTGAEKLYRFNDQIVKIQGIVFL